MNPRARRIRRANRKVGRPHFSYEWNPVLRHYTCSVEGARDVHASGRTRESARAAVIADLRYLRRIGPFRGW